MCLKSLLNKYDSWLNRHDLTQDKDAIVQAESDVLETELENCQRLLERMRGEYNALRVEQDALVADYAIQVHENESLVADMKRATDFCQELTANLNECKNHWIFSSAPETEKANQMVLAVPINSRNWHACRESVNNHFKAEIAVEEIDRNAYNSFLTEHIKPVIVGNGGKIEGHGKDREAYSCSYADLERIVLRTSVPHTLYEEETGGCDDKATAFLEELKATYGVTATAYVSKKSYGNRPAHAFAAVWLLDAELVIVCVTRRRYICRVLDNRDTLTLLSAWREYWHFGS